tara:strand:+ start:81 stop:857 length:777 start_codon:yes stop_codon:yes gene_type:complete
MSSIYRKGRDGYFYYQTYIYNHKTGKKDKRIFHSLGTKERTDAESKQSILDKKYSLLPKHSLMRKIVAIKFPLMGIPLTIFCTVCLTLFITNYSNQKNNIENNSISDQNISINKAQEYNVEKVEDKLIQKAETENSVKHSLLNEKDVIAPKIPKYSIIRFEKSSGLFDQAKIYITVPSKSQSESLLLLCERLMNIYSEYSNIVICLYANNDIGKKMAYGKLTDLTSEDQMDAWMAMYTYNSVEGTYFDDSPGGYIGAF